MILASGLEGMDGFRQRWSLHGQLGDTRYCFLFNFVPVMCSLMFISDTVHIVQVLKRLARKNVFWLHSGPMVLTFVMIHGLT
jgi:hypothetical protein